LLEIGGVADGNTRCVVGNGALEVEIISPKEYTTFQVDERIGFEAVAELPDGKDKESQGSLEWAWDFDDGTSSDENPTQHAFRLPGWFHISVTATTEEAKGSDDIYLFVEGAGTRDADYRLWIDKPPPPFTYPGWPYDEVCDGMEVIFEIKIGAGEFHTIQWRDPGEEWQGFGGGYMGTFGDYKRYSANWQTPSMPHQNVTKQFRGKAKKMV